MDSAHLIYHQQRGRRGTFLLLSPLLQAWMGACSFMASEDIQLGPSPGGKAMLMLVRASPATFQRFMAWRV